VALHKTEPNAALVAAAAEATRSEAPTYWVCLALLLGLIFLAARIASVL